MSSFRDSLMELWSSAGSPSAAKKQSFPIAGNNIPGQNPSRAGIFAIFNRQRIPEASPKTPTYNFYHSTHSPRSDNGITLRAAGEKPSPSISTLAYSSTCQKKQKEDEAGKPRKRKPGYLKCFTPAKKPESCFTPAKKRPRSYCFAPAKKEPESWLAPAKKHRSCCFAPAKKEPESCFTPAKKHRSCYFAPTKKEPESWLAPAKKKPRSCYFPPTKKEPESWLTPAKMKPESPAVSPEATMSHLDLIVGVPRPKVYILEGYNDYPRWLDQARIGRSIDKSMLVSNIAEADIIVLVVGSMEDPVLSKRLSEIPHRGAKVITVSRNFRLEGIPGDQCPTVTANPSPDFCGVSDIDTSTRGKLPSYRPSRFTVGIIANKQETAIEWINQRRISRESLQVDGHTIRFVSNHKPEGDSRVDGYIVIAEKHLETIDLPQGPWPMVTVIKDPDMDALAQLAYPTRNTRFILCRSDPLPCLVKRIIYRRLARRAREETTFSAILDQGNST